MVTAEQGAQPAQGDESEGEGGLDEGSDVEGSALDEVARAAGQEGRPRAKKNAELILSEQIEEGSEGLRENTASLLISSVSAGLDLGFTLLAVLVVSWAFHEAPRTTLISRLCMGLAYPIGYVFIVLGRSSLFTEHTTLATLPVLDGRAPVSALMRLWAVIYVGNIFGITLIAALLAYLAPALHIVDRQAFVDMATHLTSPSWLDIGLSGLLAGWLMGLLSWLVTASRDTISQIALVVLVTGAIGFFGLHHCVAGAGEVIPGVMMSEELTWRDGVTCIGMATLGNALGGVLFVALFKYSWVMRNQRATDHERREREAIDHWTHLTRK